MIYFYDYLVNKTFETIKESYDCADILNDLNRINQMISNIKLYGDCTLAYDLDRELRQKYPYINKMVDFANSFYVTMQPSRKKYSKIEAILSNLEQDYYGILCGTAIQNGLVHNIKEFIKAVD